jgi:hypothetical protein
MTAAFVAAHFLLAGAAVVTSLPLLLHEQQSPDVVCSHTIYSIFGVGNHCHTQLVDELLHGMVLRSASISIVIPTCLSFFGIICRIFLTTRLSSISSLSSRRLVMSLFMRITKSSMDPVAERDILVLLQEVLHARRLDTIIASFADFFTASPTFISDGTTRKMAANAH